MAMTISTNVMSLNAQRNLSSTQSSMSQAMQRLSSGMRVSSARDDAAGLAIAERMTSQIRGSNVAIRNCNDAISMFQTAEGAMGKLQDNLQRIRELAVQAANGAISNTDRLKLQDEVNQLSKEVSRIVDTTAFNGTKLFFGGDTALEVSDTANATLTAARSTYDDAKTALTSKSAELTIAQVAATDSTDAGVTTAQGAVTTAESELQAARDALTAASSATPEVREALQATIDDAIVTLDARKAALVSAQVAATDSTATGVVTAQAAKDAAQAAYDAAKSNLTVALEANGSSSIAIKEDLIFQVGANSEDRIPVDGTVFDLTGINTYEWTKEPDPTENKIDITDPEKAAAAITSVSNDIDTISKSRAMAGALQSRFEATAAQLQIYAENSSAARGRILDADFAVETANLAKAQILQQAGTAMVAQANMLPQQVLKLLGN